MRVVTVRDFRDRATEMFRSEDVVLVTRDGKPAGIFVPWDRPDLPVQLRREMFIQLGESIRSKREAAGITEDEVLKDFAAKRASKRRRS